MCNKSYNRDMFKLFIKLIKYINVFFKENAKKFLSHEFKNHAINLNENNFSYKLIYSLSIIKLRILQKYSNNILIKS